MKSARLSPPPSNSQYSGLLTLFQKSLDRHHQFVDDLVFSGMNPINKAASQMVFKNLFADSVQCSSDRGNLVEDVVTIRILLHHAADAFYLPLDPLQPSRHVLLELFFPRSLASGTVTGSHRCFGCWGHSVHVTPFGSL